MEDIQNLNATAFDSVGDDVGGDDHFAGHGDAAGAATFGEIFEALAAIPYALGFGEDGFCVRLLCEVGSNPIKIFKGVGSPVDSSQRQRSAPTWRRHLLPHRPLRSCQHRLALRFHGFGQPAMSVLRGTAPMRWQQ